MDREPINAKIAQLEIDAAQMREMRIAGAIDQCVRELRIPFGQRQAWLSRALADESILDELRDLPPNRANAQ